VGGPRWKEARGGVLLRALRHLAKHVVFLVDVVNQWVIVVNQRILVVSLWVVVVSISCSPPRRDAVVVQIVISLLIPGWLRDNQGVR
jgi:hypothetical protein